MKGTPMGFPSHVPEPKSGWTAEFGPIVLTQAPDNAATGNWSTGVFQMLSAGSTLQVPIEGACAEAETAVRQAEIK
jgi:hypothetical protein